MSLRINDTVPTFKANTSEGEIDFHEWIGDSWVILFSHPKDFTPVCTTEFAAVATLAQEWTNRNTKVIGISVDSVEDHKKWIADIEKYSGSQVGFPIIADEDLKVAKLYDMLPAEAILPDGRTAADSATVRSVFIIGPDKKLKLSMTYPMTIGRNFAEVLRALDALQASSSKNIATPADWLMGQDVIIPMSVSNDEAQKQYGNYETIFPYLRKTSFPN